MLPPGFELSAMQPADYDEVMALWNACEGVRVNETRAELERILARNAGLSATIRRGQALAAAVLCCHDGRRGYLYHLGVSAAFRQRVGCTPREWRKGGRPSAKTALAREGPHRSPRPGEARNVPAGPAQRATLPSAEAVHPPPSAR